MGLSTKIRAQDWREVTPNYLIEWHKHLLVVPGISKGPVEAPLITNLAAKARQLYYGTQLATRRSTEPPSIYETESNRLSRLYDEYTYEMLPKPAKNQRVDIVQVCKELEIVAL